MEHVDSESAPDRLVRKTPWWSLSVGFHVVVALLIGFFWVVQAEGTEDIPPRIKTMEKVLLPDMERHEVFSTVPIERPEKSVDPSFTKEKDDHREDPTEEDFNNARGKTDEMAEANFSGKQVNASIGLAGGASGRKGTPFGGRKYRRPGPGNQGPTIESEDAVAAALDWLARHQNPDGSWSVAAYTRKCAQTCSPNPGHDDFDAGVTGLSLLAFLGAGYSHLSKDAPQGICYGDVVRRGLQWMMGHQDPEGCIGSRSAQKYMYNHTICALAITEAFGLTGSNLFKDQAQRAVDFVVAAQNPGRGWRYSQKSGDNDSSVTGWAVMVLKSAELSSLAVPKSGYDGTRAWYDEVTEESYGRVGYTHKGTGKVFVPGMNEQFDHHEALTSIAVMARIFMDKNKADARLLNGCDLLLRDKPRWEGNATDFYYWYYASLALFQYDGPKGPKWLSWNEPMKDALVKNQNARSTGCRRGSWEPVDRWSGEGGRVYATAINCLTLEVYYRYANVLGVR